MPVIPNKPSKIGNATGMPTIKKIIKKLVGHDFWVANMRKWVKMSKGGFSHFRAIFYAEAAFLPYF